jgi:hypothetical protein
MGKTQQLLIPTLSKMMHLIPPSEPYAVSSRGEKAEFLTKENYREWNKTTSLPHRLE